MNISDLPAVNASLNLLATLLLAAGYIAIKQRKEGLHRNCMLSAFAVSCAFLGCYLYYHYFAGHVRFGGPSPYREAYLAMLVSHILLAAAVPFLALASIILGLRNARRAHRIVSRFTFPIWMYVSVTGVLIYVMLYRIWPPLADR